MESQSQSEVNDVVTDMLDHAKTQNELYWQDFEEQKNICQCHQRLEIR